MTTVPIAIVGMAARLPMAADVEEYWSNLVDNRDCITRISDEDLLAAGAARADLDRPEYVRAVPVIPDAGGFDANFFGIAPRDAQVTDPQQRLFLETSYLAAENAGYDPYALPGKVGVFAGASHSEYAERYIKPDPELYAKTGQLAVAVGNHNDYIASTVAYWLNLVGPAVTLATACSSSLVAIHLAYISLGVGEIDMALAGGVCLEMPYGHGYRWVPGSVLSRDGTVRPFDAAANGTIFGSGVGVVALRRLDDALAAGDPIRAVILGSAVNNDGSAKVSFSAPSVNGQSAVIEEAMLRAGLRPDQIGYVEAHGTGTVIGDPLELTALEQAYVGMHEGRLPPGSIALGSVKSHIGHVGQAAGVAGLIKAVLCLEREQIPPTRSFAQFNPAISADTSPFRVTSLLEAWPRGDEPRHAAVSSFGIGGTNAHVTLAEAPRAEHQPDLSAQPILWSAHTEASMHQYAGRLSAYLAARPDADLAAAARTLQRSRTGHRYRAGLVAADPQNAARLLADGKYHTMSAAGVRSRRTIFVLPGQGSQYPGMGLSLYRANPVFATAADEAFSALAEAGCDLADQWQSGRDLRNDTRLIQPLLLAIDYAMARALMAQGLTPSTLIGHSLGELAAACLAEVMTLRACARVVVARASAMADQPPGRMIAATAAPADLEALLGADVCVAAVNGPAQTVLGVSLAGLEAATSALSAARIGHRVLDTSHAFHTPMMDPAVGPVLAALEDVELSAPQIPIVLTASGRAVTEVDALDPAFWAGNITRPVCFGAAAEEALGESAVLVEAGPSAALTVALSAQPAVESADSVAIAAMPKPQPGTQGDEPLALLTAVTQAWVEGADVTWPNKPGTRTCMALPPYPFERTDHWHHPDIGSARRGAASPDPGPLASRSPHPPALVTVLDHPSPRWGGTRRRGPVRPRSRDETALTLLPQDEKARRRLIAWLRQCGYSVIPLVQGTQFSTDSNGFTMDLHQAGDQFRMALSALPESKWPAVVVHGLGLGTDWQPPSPQIAEDQLDRGVRSLIAVAQGCMRSTPGRAHPRLMVLTSRGMDVSGAEPLDPLKAAMSGLVASLRLEEPRLEARMIDVSERTADITVVAELLQDQAPAVVALRNDRRWLRVERALAVRDEPDAIIRPSGVYLITGGLGALGAATTRALAQTGLEPIVVLTGRSPHPLDGEDKRAQRRLRELERSEADVHYISADITSPRDVRRCLDLIGARFGVVNGVFHAAGVAGDGLLAIRQAAQVDAVLAPKIQGSLILEEQFAQRPPLDFFVHFSSRASITGLVGSADYAAANAFLDAHASTSALARGRVVAVNWPSWGEGGMASKGQPIAASLTSDGNAADDSELLLRTQTIHPDATWLVDEHRLGDTPLLPGTGYIDLILTAAADELPDVAGVVVENLVVATPLVVAGPREIWLTARSGGGARKVRVLSRASESDAWSEHATARLSNCADPEPPMLDLDYLAGKLKPGDLEAVLADKGLLTFGPRWHCLTAVYGSADGDEWLCEVRLPERFADDLRNHFAHPALLDMATAPATIGAEGHYLPYGYEAVRAFQPMPQHCWAHIRRVPTGRGSVRADVTVADTVGAPVLTIRGLIFKWVDGPVSLDAGQVSNTGGTRTPSVLGLPSAKAARLLLDLLDTSRRHVVGVAPFVNGVAAVGVLDSVPAPARMAQPPTSFALTPMTGHTGYMTAQGQDSQGLAPSQPQITAELLASILSDVLGIESADVDDDFFELGGNSLSAVSFIAAIQESLGVEVGIGSLLDYPTPRLLVQGILGAAND